jgi:hypothetical protein
MSVERFFTFLKAEKMHQNDSFAWGMVDCVHNVVLATTKHVIFKSPIFFLEL